MDKLLKNANKMMKLVGLNDYIDEIEVGLQKNFIPTYDLGLS